MKLEIVTTSAVLSSAAEMLETYALEAPNAGLADGVNAIAEALNRAAVEGGGSTDKPFKIAIMDMARR